MMFTLSPFTLSFCLPLAVVLYGMSTVIFLQCLADDVHIVTLHCSLVFPMSRDLPLTLLPMMFIPFCILSTVLSCCMVILYAYVFISGSWGSVFVGCIVLVMSSFFKNCFAF